jgi:hypothetical protein
VRCSFRGCESCDSKVPKIDFSIHARNTKINHFFFSQIDERPANGGFSRRLLFPIGNLDPLKDQLRCRFGWDVLQALETKNFGG